MLYFKHQELVKKYHVSLKTVHNWIDAAKQGKLELEMYEKGSRTYISSSTLNVSTLERLVEQGKKYRNARFHKIATPAQEFYDLYTRKQILDIITNLNIHHEIPRQYNYIDKGASNWDAYTRRLSSEDVQNPLKNTIELLRTNLDSIDLLLKGYDRINVVDIGPGNAMPVRELLEHLLERGVLHRYIAIDISDEMLRIAERNITKWFGDKIKFEGYVRDISYERFDDVLLDDMLAKNAEKTVNLGLLLGGTPVNFRSPSELLRVICGSMGQNDMLIYTGKADNEVGRINFNLHVKEDGVPRLSPVHSYIFDLLNVDESLYDVEMGFNEQKRVRYIRVRLKVALTIKFKFGDSERNVNFDKGETILLWRAWHMTALEITSYFEEAGFGLMQLGLMQDRQYLLSIFGVDITPELEA